MNKYGPYKDTGEFMAVKFPFLAGIAKKMDATLGIVHSQMRGFSDITFKSQGIDLHGRLKVKRISLLAFVDCDEPEREQRIA